MAEISVVIPTYNRAALLKLALDAVLAQSRAPDEIIVVDDGSTDATEDMVAAYGAAVTYIRSTNSGPLVSRNIGVSAARGRLVAFCDSDDLWQPAFLETMERVFQASPELGAAYTNFSILRDGKVDTETKFDDAPAGFWAGLRDLLPGVGIFDEGIVPQLLQFQPFFPSCLMVNRTRFQELGGWDEGVSRIIGCDFATALRLVNAPPVAVVRSPLVHIRKHTGNLSGDTERMNLGNARVLEYVLRTRPELEVFRAAFLDSINHRRLDALHNAFARRDFPAVRDIDHKLSLPVKSVRANAKRAIARLPHPLAYRIAALVSEGVV